MDSEEIVQKERHPGGEIGDSRLPGRAHTDAVAVVGMRITVLGEYLKNPTAIHVVAEAESGSLPLDVLGGSRHAVVGTRGDFRIEFTQLDVGVEYANRAAAGRNERDESDQDRQGQEGAGLLSHGSPPFAWRDNG